jgi:NADH-quinone oxidoreductase subunit K
MAVPPAYYLLLSAAVLCIGVAGVLTRRNALFFLMAVELMLNAANINFVYFAQYWGNATGQAFSLLVIALAAAEVAIGLGIVLVLYRSFDGLDVTEATTMRR